MMRWGFPERKPGKGITFENIDKENIQNNYSYPNKKKLQKIKIKEAYIIYHEMST